MKKITPTHHFFDFELRELWQNRELLWVLVKRDVQVRYKNTALGILWVILQPLMATLIFTLVFTQVLRFGTQEENYLIYTLIGFIFWQFFSGGVTYATTSVYEQISMIKKIYFPRLFLPLTVILRALFDLLVSAIFLMVVMIWKQVNFSWAGVIGFFLSTMILLILTCGISFIFASLNARYRDLRHLIPFLLQIWFYATPVFYSASLLTGKLTWLAQINPVTQVLILVRQAIFQQTVAWPILAILLPISLVILILGIGIFKQMENEVVDWT